MDDVVHDDEPAGGGRILAVAVPGVQQHCHVVIPRQQSVNNHVQQHWHVVIPRQQSINNHIQQHCLVVIPKQQSINQSYSCTVNK